MLSGASDSIFRPCGTREQNSLEYWKKKDTKTWMRREAVTVSLRGPAGAQGDKYPSLSPLSILLGCPMGQASQPEHQVDALLRAASWGSEQGRRAGAMNGPAAEEAEGNYPAKWGRLSEGLCDTCRPVSQNDNSTH